jgi:two-component system sensor histidine kinase MprB
MSFRLKLTVLTALAIAVTVAGASIAVWVIAKHQLLRQVDRDLQSQAIQALSSHGPGPFGQIAYVIIDQNGNTVRQSVSLPVNATEKQVAAGTRNEYYADQTIRGTHARVYAAALPGGGAVITAESLQSTDKALHQIGFWIVLISCIGIGVAAALAAFVAAAALRPVRRLTAAAETVAATGASVSR